MAPKRIWAALAPMVVLAMVATLRPASASRPSSDMGGVQEAPPLTGLRRLVGRMHGEEAAELGSMRHLLAAGNPKCPAPYTPCNKQCTNLQSDADNCGACGKVCPNNNECSAGKCKPVGGSGPTVATATTKTTKTKCVSSTSPSVACYYDTKCSNNNCGACGICCPREAYCWFGQCICPMNTCLCNVNGKLKCLKHGQYCPQSRTFCCKAGYTSCATGCCPLCSDTISGFCQTPKGKVCCPTAVPGTRCHGPSNNRQCCADDQWTGATTQTCCPADKKPVQCEAFNGDRTPPKLCCDPDLACRFNQNPDPANPTKPIGYACISQACAPPSVINPKCLETTDEVTDPPCCCKKCQDPYVPSCPADSSGKLNKNCGASSCGCKCPTDLWTGTRCCPKKKCGTSCCTNADDVCYTKNGQQACCPKANWTGRTCCPSKACETSSGKVCCPSGQACQTVPGANNDVCCAPNKWTGTQCCTTVVCGTICCPRGDDMCYTPTAASGAVRPAASSQQCCPKGQWTGPPKNQCCPADKEPVKCEARSGDPPPPTVCCDPGLACKYNDNPDPANPTKPIGYSCISQSCPPPASIDPKCTAATSETTDPPCCCIKCSDGYVPQCPASLPTGCNEPGGSGCGCKCASKKVCGTKCCPNADDVCYTVASQPACCPKGRWVDGQCCPRTPAICPNGGGLKCCPAGQECHQRPIGSNFERVCCPAGQWLPFPISNPTCCAEKLCQTARGAKCCKSAGAGVKCQSAGDYDTCCTDAAWTGTTCCTGDLPNAATCPDKTKICCPPDSKCYKDSTGKNDCCELARWNDQTGCCPQERWTGTECCPADKKNCFGECIEKDICCTDDDCPCPVPTGPAIASACPEKCCMQYLCCNVDGKRQCIQPDDSNCAACGVACGEGETCALNTCAPLS